MGKHRKKFGSSYQGADYSAGDPAILGFINVGKGPVFTWLMLKTKAGFTPWVNTISWGNNQWSGTVKDYNQNGEFWGFVTAGQGSYPSTFLL